MALAAMPRATMVTHVEKAIGQPQGSADADLIDDLLDKAYGFTLPSRSAGLCVRGTIDLVLTASDTNPYDLGELHPIVRSVVRPLLIEGSEPLDYYSDAKQFYEDVAFSTSTRNTPTSVLVEGKFLTLNPLPDAAATLVVHCAQYREPIPDAGLKNLTEAWAVIFETARSIAVLRGQDNVAGRCQALFNDAMTELVGDWSSSEDVAYASGRNF